MPKPKEQQSVLIGEKMERKREKNCVVVVILI